MKKHISGDQPTNFEFTKDNTQKVEAAIAKYPPKHKKSAVMPLLDIAQEQCEGWIPTVAMGCIANTLNMAPIEVYEIASFYSMYNLAPVGKYLIQICRTTSCWLCGSNDILRACQEFLGIKLGQTTPDNLFTLIEVECLGACVDAPVVQINKKYYERLTRDKIISILSKLQSLK